MFSNLTVNNARVLLVEDHRVLAESVLDFLQTVGFETDYAADGLTGLHLASHHAFDVIILDVMLPGLNGLDLCAKLRKEKRLSTPILLLTARDQLQDKLEGFQQGADDYLVKPFDLPELVARLVALLRRARGEVAADLLQVADLTLDTGTLELKRNGQPIHLSPSCLRIVKILMRESPRVVTREALEQELWGDLTPDSDTLRSHLYKIRRAIDKPFAVPLLHTIAGQGFKLALLESPSAT